MNLNAFPSAPPRRTRRIVLVGLAVLGLAAAAFAVRRPLLMTAPTCLAGRWHGCLDTENGVVLMMLLGLPPAAVVASALAYRRRGLGVTAGRMLAPLTRIADAFDSMLARLEANVAEQRRFAANASHELRTPLTISRTLLEVARTDPTHHPADWHACTPSTVGAGAPRPGPVVRRWRERLG